MPQFQSELAQNVFGILIFLEGQFVLSIVLFLHLIAQSRLFIYTGLGYGLGAIMSLSQLLYDRSDDFEQLCVRTFLLIWPIKRCKKYPNFDLLKPGQTGVFSPSEFQNLGQYWKIL